MHTLGRCRSTHKNINIYKLIKNFIFIFVRSTSDSLAYQITISALSSCKISSLNSKPHFHSPKLKQPTTMSENHLDRATMRVSMVARHLNVVVPPTDIRSTSSSAFVRALPCSNAAADGPRNDSYHRVHGQVSSHPVDWRNIPGDDSGREFTDIVYEKAVGEGIAKVNIVL